MELELTICRASDVVELVRARDRDNIPFSIVISLEGPGDDTEERAPRLITEIGPEWAERQIIFACNDVESGPGVPSRLFVQNALDYFAKATIRR